MDKHEIKTENSQPRAPREREAPLPLPRTPNTSKDSLRIIRGRTSADFDQSSGFHSGPSAKRKGYRLALWSWLASFIDLLILISLSCVFIISFSLIVQSPVGEMFRSIPHQQHRMVFFAEVMLVASWLYLIVSRGIMGSSLGEWTCDLRLGQPQERLNSSYILKVGLRASIVILSGVVVLPIISLIVGKDLAGSLSGIKLFSLK